MYAIKGVRKAFSQQEAFPVQCLSRHICCSCLVGHLSKQITYAMAGSSLHPPSTPAGGCCCRHSAKRNKRRCLRRAMVCGHPKQTHHTIQSCPSAPRVLLRAQPQGLIRPIAKLQAMVQVAPYQDGFVPRKLYKKRQQLPVYC